MTSKRVAFITARHKRRKRKIVVVAKMKRLRYPSSSKMKCFPSVIFSICDQAQDKSGSGNVPVDKHRINKLINVDMKHHLIYFVFSFTVSRGAFI